MAGGSISPITILYGSFDLFVDLAVLPGIESGELSRLDMIAVVAALRAWEETGHGTGRIHARPPVTLPVPCALARGAFFANVRFRPVRTFHGRSYRQQPKVN